MQIKPSKCSWWKKNLKFSVVLFQYASSMDLLCISLKFLTKTCVKKTNISEGDFLGNHLFLPVLQNEVTELLVEGAGVRQEASTE